MHYYSYRRNALRLYRNHCTIIFVQTQSLQYHIRRDAMHCVSIAIIAPSYSYKRNALLFVQTQCIASLHNHCNIPSYKRNALIFVQTQCIASLSQSLQYHIRTDTMHCVSTQFVRVSAIPNPTIWCGRLPNIPDSDRASRSQYRRGTPPKT